MPITQISKMLLRRGHESDMPGAPVTLIPLVFSAGLDEGELGFTTDTGRLFIGQNPTAGQPNYNRSDFPFRNIEVLTENTPLGVIAGQIVKDNRDAFITTVPLNATTSFQTLQVFDVENAPHPLYFESATGANASIHYFVFDAGNLPIRIGHLNLLWNSSMVGEPLLSDDATVPAGDELDIQWHATVTGSIGNQHVILEYKNLTGGLALVILRMDRPTV